MVLVLWNDVMVKGAGSMDTPMLAQSAGHEVFYSHQQVPGVKAASLFFHPRAPHVYQRHN